MNGRTVHEPETDIDASELWGIYGTLSAVELFPQLCPHVLINVKIISGDGSVGTILQLTFPPGDPSARAGMKKFTKVDNEDYIKEAKAIEGDILKLGFLSYMIQMEVIAKGPALSVLRLTVEYENDDTHPNLESKVSIAPLAAIAQVFAKYVKENKVPQVSSKNSLYQSLSRHINE
ncbi:norbelladine synthase-like [Phragmites australis]|uniref:norbelladine synthase-like n=1 Tax=Phragmites australis TaxID=29695 RepID=UPI002D780247|nr:norbelladine synthase-like [Phragmites australis]